MPTCFALPVKATSPITSIPSGITICGFFLSLASPFSLRPGTTSLTVPVGVLMSCLYPICFPSLVILKSSRVQVKDASSIVPESVEAALDSSDAVTLLSSRLFVWRLVLLTSIRVWVSIAFSEFSASVTDSEALEDLVDFAVSVIFAASLELEELIFSEDFTEVLYKAPPHAGFY